MNIRIQMASLEDLDRLMEMEAQCFPPAEVARREDYAYRIKQLGTWFRTAVADGRIVGFLNGRATPLDVIVDELYEPRELPEGAYFAVLCLETEPALRGRGVAAALMDDLIGRARAAGLRGITLACKDKLVAYYEKFGFRRVGNSASVYGGAAWNDMRLEL